MPKKKKSTAKKKTSTTKSPRRKKHEAWEGVELSMSPETTLEISAIVLVVAGVLFGLSLFELLGSTGEFLGMFLRETFGWSAYIFSASLIIFGMIMFFPSRFVIRPSTYIGFAMINVVAPMFFHLFVDIDSSYQTALDGAGGGFIGYFLGTGLKGYISMTGAVIVALALFVISLLVLFNTSLRRLQEKIEEDPYRISVEPPKGLNKLKINVPAPSIKEKFDGMMKKGGKKGKEVPEAKEEEKEEQVKTEIQHSDVDWKFPSIDLLEETKYNVDSGNVTGNAEIISKTLSQFGIRVTMQDVNVGPTFTQYTLKPAEGTKLSKITALQDDLALALAVHPIRIEAPIPGKSLVGVEIPNKKTALVRLKEVLSSGEYRRNIGKEGVVVALGKDVSGNPAVADISKMPHLLVAGSTGSGKSVCVNAILASILFHYSPKEVRLIMVDPKRVEMTGYNGIAHLLTPVITEPDKTVNAFRWAVMEMESRYKLLSEKGARDIAGYNKKLGADEEKMPYLVIIVDELADVMMQAAQEMEGLIVRIAQMARAVGIHLVLATQRPSVNVVTGLIKANVPCRIAFRVASQVDSRTILDMAGAERLIGKGDMLFMAGDGQRPKRIQSVFVDDKEIGAILDNVKGQQEPQYNEDVVKSHKAPGAGGGGGGGDGEIDDDMYQQAYEEVVSSGKASASLLQRRLRVGYARAARLLDLLEDQGVIGPSDGAKAREILVSRDDGEMVIDSDGDYGDDEDEML